MPASPYVANPLATQVPSPAPGPGTLPIAMIPAGTDAPSISSIVQQVKVNTDLGGYLQSTAKFRPPRTPNGLTGFTAVVQNGGGTGTIAPTAISTTQAQSTSLGSNFVYKVTLAGVVGVAKFQYSTDGGANFNGADITTSATDSSSGVTVSMAGTFNLGTLYAFSCTDVSLATFADVNQNIRGLAVDHQGYPMGPYMEFREDWLGSYASIGPSQTRTSTFNRWAATTGATGAIATNGMAAGYGGLYMTLDPGATSGSKAYLMPAGTSLAAWLNPSCTFLDAVMEFDFSMSALGANGLKCWGGWSSTDTPDSVSSQQLLLYWTSGGVGGAGALGLIHADGGLSIIDILPFVPAAGSNAPNIRCRIEYHGSATPLGNCARVFLAQGVGMPWQLVDVVTAHLPTVGLYPFFGAYANSASPTATLRLGTNRVMWNRFAVTGGEL